MMKVEVYGIEVNYEEIGKGIPIIIIPGLFISSKSMMPAMEPILSDMNKFRRIYIDMPGMGQTPKHNMENSSESMIKILISFVEKVIGKEKLYVMGYSYGGYLATGLARALEEQAIGEIRVCGVVNAKMKDRNLPENETIEVDEEFLKNLSEEEQKFALKDMAIINEKTFSRYKVEVYDELRKADRKFILDLFFNKYNYELLEKERIPVKRPVLFIVGKQDSVCGYKDTLSILDYYENPTVHILNRASHNLHIEQEETFNMLIKDWLRNN